jgi:lipopolysaccharide transport system ATP-binding protein
MASCALRVEGLSKSFRIGSSRVERTTLVESLADAVYGPFRRVGAVLRGHAPDASDTEFWALRDVSFEVGRGEVVGVVGRNGAGKSTLLKILSRISAPTRGTVSVSGRIGSLLEVGTGFHPELTGRENIRLNGAILGMSRADVTRRFDEIVAFAEVEQFLDTPVKHYSSGMYMRLAFAVAAHLESEILLVDEVLAVGDSAFQRKCIGKMGEVAHEGRTVMFVSHNMTAVSQLCTRAIYLVGGTVVSDGPVAETVLAYLSSIGSSTGEHVWPLDEAPRNENVELHAVRVVSGGVSRGEVPLDEPVELRVDFRCLRPKLDDLCVNIYLLDGMGMTVLSTANTPWANAVQDPWFGSEHVPGMYRATCTIPADFLNEGRYYVTVYLVTLTPLEVEARAEHAVSFSTLDRGSMREAGMGGPWVGAIRVRLPWTTIPLETGEFVEHGNIHEGSVQGALAAPTDGA